MNTANEEAGQYLGLFIGQEEYGIGILRVKEILRCEPITRVPGTPPGIRGVINVRGSVVPVVDLAVRFGLPETAITRLTCIVVVEVELGGDRTVMGVMADSVSQVIDLAVEEIRPAPGFGTGVGVDYLQGMGRRGKKFLLLLDTDRVLSTHDLLAATSLGEADARAERSVQLEGASA
jgi:purine-binding chemotaxis protein CheW